MQVPSRRGRPAHPDALTPAEWRVAERVRHGMSNPAIAKRLGVSVDAVKFHVANILLKLGMARRAELRNWSGVRRDSHLASKSTAANAGTGRPLGEIAQIARSVRDIVSAEQWYRDVLRLPHLYTFGTLAFFDCGGTRLMLSEGDGQADSILYFRVDDIHASLRDLGERGAVIVAAPHLIHRHDDGTEEWLAFFNDNEGRALALMEQVNSPQESNDEED